MPGKGFTMPNLISIRSAAELAAVSERTIRRRIADGTITGYRVGPKLLRVKRSEVEQMTRQIPTASDPTA